MKKPKAVIEAEAALVAKAAEVAAAKETLKRLEAEHGAAYAAIRKAQTDADMVLPQCDMIRVKWRSGVRENMGRVVILRRTPTFMLVVRPVGSTSEHTYKFKWLGYSGKFVQAEKSYYYTQDTRELDNVPDEFTPKP